MRERKRTVNHIIALPAAPFNELIVGCPTPKTELADVVATWVKTGAPLLLLLNLNTTTGFPSGAQ